MAKLVPVNGFMDIRLIIRAGERWRPWIIGNSAGLASFARVKDCRLLSQSWRFHRKFVQRNLLERFAIVIFGWVRTSKHCCRKWFERIYCWKRREFSLAKQNKQWECRNRFSSIVRQSFRAVFVFSSSFIQPNWKSIMNDAWKSKLVKKREEMKTTIKLPEMTVLFSLDGWVSVGVWVWLSELKGTEEEFALSHCSWIDMEIRMWCNQFNFISKGNVSFRSKIFNSNMHDIAEWLTGDGVTDDINTLESDTIVDSISCHANLNEKIRQFFFVFFSLRHPIVSWHRWQWVAQAERSWLKVA